MLPKHRNHGTSHENRHMERQFAQRAPAASKRLARRPPARYIGAARAETGTRQIPRRCLSHDGLAHRVGRAKNLQRRCHHQPPRAARRANRLAHAARQLAQYPKLVLLGDFNIAPADDDVYDPQRWHEKILCSGEERQWFANLLNLGLHDALRHIHPTGAHYTWWDYRGAMFAKGLGMRIDHLLISPALRDTLRSVSIDNEARAQERPSDHAPVVAEWD